MAESSANCKACSALEPQRAFMPASISARPPPPSFHPPPLPLSKTSIQPPILPSATPALHEVNQNSSWGDPLAAVDTGQLAVLAKRTEATTRSIIIPPLPRHPPPPIPLTRPFTAEASSNCIFKADANSKRLIKASAKS